MTMKIYKYQINLLDPAKGEHHYEIEMPARTSKILCVGKQKAAQFNEVNGAVITLWAQVYLDEQSTHTRKINVYGTGHELPVNPGYYIGTVIFEDACLVWHVYDGGELKK